MNSTILLFVLYFATAAEWWTVRSALPPPIRERPMDSEILLSSSDSASATDETLCVSSSSPKTSFSGLPEIISRLPAPGRLLPGALAAYYVPWSEGLIERKLITRKAFRKFGLDQGLIHICGRPWTECLISVMHMSAYWSLGQAESDEFHPGKDGGPPSAGCGRRSGPFVPAGKGFIEHREIRA